MSDQSGDKSRLPMKRTFAFAALDWEHVRHIAAMAREGGHTLHAEFLERLADDMERAAPSHVAALDLKHAESAALWVESPDDFLDGWGGKELPPTFRVYAERLYRAYKEVSEKLSASSATAPLEITASLMRKGWNAGVKRSAEVAEHYAKLMKSEAAQRAADEIRALKSSAALSADDSSNSARTTDGGADNG